MQRDEKRGGIRGMLQADAYYPGPADLPWELYASAGVKLALIDIDNTLAVHGLADSTDFARVQIARIRDAGLNPVLLSNAMADRAQSFADSFGMEVIGQANKPSTSGIDRAREQYGMEKHEVVMVGDQLFTDVMAGCRAGVWTVRVDPIDTDEPWWILLKRFGERLLRRPLGYTKHYDNITDRLQREGRQTSSPARLNERK